MYTDFTTPVSENNDSEKDISLIVHSLLLSNTGVNSRTSGSGLD